MSTVLESLVVSLVPTPHLLTTLSDDFTSKQKLFIYYYLEHKNGTKAAKQAGYAGDDNVLAGVAYENLRKPQIRNEIDNYYKSRLLSKDGVLAELSDIASSPWREHVEVKTDDEGNVVHAQLRLADKIRAAELVGKFHGAFIEKTENINVEMKADDNLTAIKTLARNLNGVELNDEQAQELLDRSFKRLAP